MLRKALISELLPVLDLIGGARIRLEEPWGASRSQEVLEDGRLVAFGEKTEIVDLCVPGIHGFQTRLESKEDPGSGKKLEEPGGS